MSYITSLARNRGTQEVARNTVKACTAADATPGRPRQTSRLAPRRSCRNQAGLVFRPAGLFTFLFSGTATRRSRNRFPTRQGGFCTPGTGGAFTPSKDLVHVSSTGTAPEVGPLTSSPPSRGQSSGGALWRAGYIPGDRLTSWVYSTTCIQYLYVSCYLSDNKLVLSYLLLCLLPHYYKYADVGTR